MTNPTGSEKLNFVPLQKPRFETGRALQLVGFRGSCAEVDALWGRFAPHIGSIPHQVGKVAYGACFGSSETPDYMAAVEVSDYGDSAQTFQTATIPVRNYAVFPHLGHVTELKDLVYTIVTKWLPTSGHTMAEVKDPSTAAQFERYGPGFNPETGKGDMEIWFPIAS